MLFNSLAYMIFLPIVFLIYWKSPFRLRTPVLLLASYVFYMWWQPIYGLLILGLTVFNYFYAFAVDKATDRKKLVFSLGIAANCITLGYFKYAYFVRDIANDASKLLAHKEIPSIPFDIILPLGISFFCFEFIHYLFEVYRGAKPVRSFMEFALFPAFFPTQIAGPIKRFADFIPQLHKPASITRQDFDEGVELILFGLFKKVVLADHLAIVVNRCYAHPDLLTGADLWLAAYSFAWQVYFDFSGYTDIARGSAKLLGFSVPINFDLPFLAGSITEIWRRWHISLSTWLRDYLFIPLGGSKFGELATLRNIMLTMIIGGFWHGAGLNYGAWGASLGLLMVAHRLWIKFYSKNETLTKIIKTRYYHVLAVFATWHFWCMSAVFMRAENPEKAFMVIRKLLYLDRVPDTSFFHASIVSTSDSILFQFLPLILIGMYAMQIIVSKSRETPGIMPALNLRLFGMPVFKPAYMALLLVVLFIWSPDFSPQFIYFQF